jgi:hypothetical protein
MNRLIFVCIFLSIFLLHCEQEYSARYLYVVVGGDYGVPFTGAYGDEYHEYVVNSRTPDYYYYHLGADNNQFTASFHKLENAKEDFRCLTVRLYLKEYPQPASLLVQMSQDHPESTITVEYGD